MEDIRIICLNLFLFLEEFILEDKKDRFLKCLSNIGLCRNQPTIPCVGNITENQILPVP